DGQMHGPAMAGMHGHAGVHHDGHSKSGEMTPCPFGAPAIGAPLVGILAPTPEAILREPVVVIDPAAPAPSFLLEIRQRGPPQSF
ncbi:MAG TPA: hypothetical protein VNH64_03640, partial [Parvularculaceae bacterium]|nr:hypothetical protein [Parvularculaceae bacterium]